MVVKDVVSHSAEQARTIPGNQLPPFPFVGQVHVLRFGKLRLHKTRRNKRGQEVGKRRKNKIKKV